METLEEQGILRALLSHTSENEYDFDENNSSHANMIDSKNKKDLTSVETRFQGTLMELEKIVQKVLAVSITTNYYIISYHIIFFINSNICYFKAYSN